MIDWISLLQTFGLAVAILFFVGWCLVRIGTWLAPIINRHFDQLAKSLEEAEGTRSRIEAVEERIDNVWAFIMRRAAVEALQKGVGHMNSPLVITDEAKSWLADLAQELKSFWRRLGRTLSDVQLMEEIEKRWGKEIVEKICIPHGLFQGVCLLIAMQVAKDVD